MLISTAKTTTWMKPLKNWPLYIAPTPGISPSTAAAEGLGPLGRRRPTKGCLIALPGRQAGLAENLPSGAPLRTQPAQSALPQFWQKAVAVTPL